jgi:hypothetical protein
MALAGEQYNMILDMLSRNIPVKLRVNIDTRFYDDDQGNAYNVLAELRVPIPRCATRSS